MDDLKPGEPAFPELPELVAEQFIAIRGDNPPRMYAKALLSLPSPT